MSSLQGWASRSPAAQPSWHHWRWLASRQPARQTPRCEQEQTSRVLRGVGCLCEQERAGGCRGRRRVRSGCPADVRVVGDSAPCSFKSRTRPPPPRRTHCTPRTQSRSSHSGCLHSLPWRASCRRVQLRHLLSCLHELVSSGVQTLQASGRHGEGGEELEEEVEWGLWWALEMCVGEGLAQFGAPLLRRETRVKRRTRSAPLDKAGRRFA